MCILMGRSGRSVGVHVDDGGGHRNFSEPGQDEEDWRKMPTIKDERKEPNGSFGRGEDEANNPVAARTKVPEERKPTTCGAVVCRSCSTTSSAHMFVVLLLLSLSVVFLLAIQLNGKISAGRMFACVANSSVGVHVDDGSGHRNFSGDKLLGGLLAARKEDKSCLSIHQFAFYRKESKYKPSFYLQQKLRRYEALHRRCAPHTRFYNKTMHQLINRNQSTLNLECNYIIWIPNAGLGNMILGITSTFLYALLTDRVLLIRSDSNIHGLFCEPFPESTWFLPQDFPFLEHFKGRMSIYRYTNSARNKLFGEDMNATSSSTHPLPIIVHADLMHYYGKEDKIFFCEQDQLLLKKFPLMVISSNLYFVPPLFTVPMFKEELGRVFPEKDTVFHHLGRYLLHPSNQVWGMIARYYQSYLANVDERIGIQIRIFDGRKERFQCVSDQIFSCISREKLLPEVDLQHHVSSNIKGKSRAIVVGSLSSWYFDKIKNMYWEHPTLNGEVVSVHQPSHEEQQHTERQSHNIKALTDVYLLSLTDVLITTARSTFGYIAQGLGGVEPLILPRPVNDTVPEPPCLKDFSMEPCLIRPLNYDCKSKHPADVELRLPHVKHCVDVPTGVKLVHHKSTA